MRMHLRLSAPERKVVYERTRFHLFLEMLAGWYFVVSQLG